MKTVEVGTNVKVHYTGTLTDGTEFDSSHKREEPISFKVGESLVLEAFEKAVVGMTEGQTKSVTLSPDEAYGPHDPAATQKVPRQAFGTEFEFEVGGTVQGNGPAGPFLAVIESVEEEHITLDMNHPLAGKELTFEIEMVEIEEEAEEEAGEE